MIWEKIGEFKQKEYTQYIQVFAADEELEAIVKEANSIREYIALKYTQCVILDRSLSTPNTEEELVMLNNGNSESSQNGAFTFFNNTPQQRFLRRLNELNRVVFSRFWDDSDCDEKIFYYFALLNFKTHKYDIALRLLNKSLKQEKLCESSEKNAVLRLHKRCMRAYCLEYLGMSTRTKMTDNTLKDAILFLIGYDVFNENESEDDISNVISKTMKCTECNKNLHSIIKILCNADVPSVFKDLNVYFEKKYISNQVYEKYLAEIAHILAHCLSEIRKINGSAFRRVHKKHVLFLRIADSLMENLGDEYVTCHATIRIENDEYFSALDVLCATREKLDDKLFKLSTTQENTLDAIKIEKQLAQIDFYSWYFSVFHRKQDGKECKKRFWKYCDKTGDPVANTYYHVVNMKEILLKDFAELKRDATIIPKDIEELKNAFANFEKYEPHYSIHTAISEEWIFLKKSYKILELCRKISEDYRDSKTVEKEISFFKLYEELFDMYNISCEYIDVVQKLRENKNFTIPFYVFELSGGGNVICRGAFDKLMSSAVESGINLSITRPKTARSSENVTKIIEDNLSNNSNIVVSIDNQKYNEDLDFISTVFEYDKRAAKSIDRHNIYIDTSELTEDNREKFYAKLSLIKKTYPNAANAYEVPNIKTAMLLGSMFAMLETHLLRLSTPLESYVISPVVDDITFDAQSCDRLVFLEQEDFDAAKTGYIPDWGFNFGYSFSNATNKKGKGKILLLEKIDTCISQIDYIFCFEKAENSWIADCHAFDIRSHRISNEKYIFSDVLYVEDHRFTNALGANKTGNDVLMAVENLFNKLKPQASKKNHMELCGTYSCPNLFVFEDLKGSGEYKSLREYLYSYMGVLLPGSPFLLLKNNEMNGRKCWMLFALSQNMAGDGETQVSLCHSLRYVSDYIKDIVYAEDICVTQPVSIVDLERQINSCSKDKKYIFISYKSKNRTAELCKPVYSDVIYLQNQFKDKLEVAIDIKNFKDQFNRDIEEYIESPSCIGAFVYLSYDYMCPMVIDENGKEVLISRELDKCFKEVELLLSRKQIDPEFRIFLIYLTSDLQKNNECCASLLELVNASFKIYRESGDMDRITLYRKLFNLGEESILGPIRSIEVFFCNRKEDASHFKTSNIKNVLRDYEIWTDE